MIATAEKTETPTTNSNKEGIWDLSLQIPIEQATITAEEFNEKYFIPQKPVLIKGLGNLQPAGGKWTTDWFKKEMADVIVDITDNREKRHLASTTVTGDIKMPLSEYIDIISKDEETPLRMFRFNLYKHKKDLKNDFSCPHIIKNNNVMKNAGFMFFGGKNTDVRNHYDIDNSNVLLTQFYGTKRVILFEKEYGELLYRLPFNTHTITDLANPDFENFPGLKLVKGYEFVMEEGDSIFMPSGCWHYNTYLSGGISVAYRKLASTFGGKLKGISNLTVMMPFDKVMNFIFRSNWMKFKKNLMYKRANKAIQKYSSKR